MTTVTPNDAALILGISRAAILKQRTRLDRSGQAGMFDGKWRVESVGLWRWWIDHVRPCESWRRLVRAKELLGEQPEELLLRLGGLDRVASLMEWLSVARPELGVNHLLEVGREGAERGIPLDQFKQLLERDMQRWPPKGSGHHLDAETGRIVDADGADLGPAWVESAL